MCLLWWQVEKMNDESLSLDNVNAKFSSQNMNGFWKRPHDVTQRMIIVW